jgi:hypothetical protein
MHRFQSLVTSAAGHYIISSSPSLPPSHSSLKHLLLHHLHTSKPPKHIDTVSTSVAASSLPLWCHRCATPHLYGRRVVASSLVASFIDTLLSASFRFALVLALCPGHPTTQPPPRPPSVSCHIPLLPSTAAYHMVLALARVRVPISIFLVHILVSHLRHSRPISSRRGLSYPNPRRYCTPILSSIAPLQSLPTLLAIYHMVSRMRIHFLSSS